MSAVPSEGSVVLSLERMTGITDIDAGSASMTVLPMMNQMVKNNALDPRQILNPGKIL